jgi:hypothetical protein
LIGLTVPREAFPAFEPVLVLAAVIRLTVDFGGTLDRTDARPELARPVGARATDFAAFISTGMS